MEEGEGENEDGCCDFDVQEFGCRGTSVFVRGSSRKISFYDETRLSRRIDGALVSAWYVRLVFDQISPG